jgi:hypothetical protein
MTAKLTFYVEQPKLVLDKQDSAAFKCYKVYTTNISELTATSLLSNIAPLFAVLHPTG